MTRPYRKSLRPQKRRGVPVGDERWANLYKFMDKNDFTMEDFLACVCANFTRYPQGYYKTDINFKDYSFEVKIMKHWRENYDA